MQKGRRKGGKGKEEKGRRRGEGYKKEDSIRS